MELLLNLAWLLLALPAYWLWRSRNSVDRTVTSLQCMLALGCTLVMLFPVISATDDLRAMRTEMEESPASKRSMRQAGGEKSSLWNSQPHPAPAALPAPFALIVPSDLAPIAPRLTPSLASTPVLLSDGRAPPTFPLA